MIEKSEKKLPNHLKQFIVDQRYSDYTAIDHAVWRYIMRQNIDFLKDHAHPVYLEGLKQTGISLERIPSIEEMDSILGKRGWGAVAVDGFIPPAAFMEFQAHRVLVIACDIRQLHHIEYTPAPDIVHEAAGHAPIIIDPEYAEYLYRFGVVGAKAMSSKEDFELYEAIRHLSILKEASGVDEAEIKKAEDDVNYKQDNLGDPSEMALLSRLHWWTVEYGLHGELDKPLLYGAGLLSSIGESVSCLSDNVKKLPYNLDTKEFAFDITTQQPQLFVSKDFKQLCNVLEEFAAGMAFNVGGTSGLNKAIECENVATAVYSSGLQVTGLFTKIWDADRESGQPTYISLSGPVALACNDIELKGHGCNYHSEGFGSPVGRLKNCATPLENATDSELNSLGIIAGNKCLLEFESGVKVAGMLDSVTREADKIVVMTFSGCTVTYGEEILFKPEWGNFDMAVGEKIVSVYCGAADKDAYDQNSLVPRERTIQNDMDEKRISLISLYQQVRDFREGETARINFTDIWEKLIVDHPDDWLLSSEILELINDDVFDIDPEDIAYNLASEINSNLMRISKEKPEFSEVIENSLRLITNY